MVASQDRIYFGTESNGDDASKSISKSKSKTKSKSWPPVSAFLAQLMAGELPLPRVPVRWATVHGDMHADNIMVDKHLNAYLIDLDSWRPGPAISDACQLEAWVLFECTDIDASLEQALRMVGPLTSSYLVASSAKELELTGGLQLAFEAVVCLRAHAADHTLGEEDKAACGGTLPLSVAVPLLARALFFVFQPEQEKKRQPGANKAFALAMACALAEVCRAAITPKTAAAN